MGAGKSHLILRAGGNLILEIKKVRPRGGKKKFAQVHTVSQNQAGAQTKGSPPHGQSSQTAGFLGLHSAAACWTRLPEGLHPRPWPWRNRWPAHPPLPCQARAIIALTGPWGSGGPGLCPHESGFQSRNLRQSHIASPQPRHCSHKPLPALFLAPPA